MTEKLRLLETTPDFQRFINDEQDEFIKLSDGRVFATGWVPRPAAVEAVLRSLERSYLPKTFEEAAPALVAMYSGTDDPVFMWDAEEKVLGKVLGSWDQGQVGSCVSFGFGRGAQDVLLNEVASGEPEGWPGAEVATEPIYGGSRVEVGGGGINGDGSVGAWAAKYVRDWGLLVRKSYSLAGKTFDLTAYDEARCRQYGESGVPNELEPEAKLHPITSIALVTTEDGLWAALGARKGVPPCSGLGFTTTRDADGFCTQTGTWNHCMLFRGRFVHPVHSRCIVWQNSWDGYLRGPDIVQYIKADGSVGTFKLPEGCFCTKLSVGVRAVSERDTFAMAGLKGWSTDPTPPAPPPAPAPGKVMFPKNLGLSFEATAGYAKQADGTYTAPGVATVRIIKLASEGGSDPVKFSFDRTFVVALLRRVAELGRTSEQPVKGLCDLLAWVLDKYYPEAKSAPLFGGFGGKDVLLLACKYSHLAPEPIRSLLAAVCPFVQK